MHTKWFYLQTRVIAILTRQLKDTMDASYWKEKLTILWEEWKFFYKHTPCEMDRLYLAGQAEINTYPSWRATSPYQYNLWLLNGNIYSNIESLRDKVKKWTCIWKCNFFLTFLSEYGFPSVIHKERKREINCCTQSVKDTWTFPRKDEVQFLKTLLWYVARK